MKRIFACMLIAVMLLSAAFAEVISLSDELFLYAKSTLAYLASGNYDQAVTSIPFSDFSPSADEWRSFAEGSFSSLAGTVPQQKYAVAYWQGSCWKIAVPVSEPSSDTVETLVLTSDDGQSFSGYGCALWGQVSTEYQRAEYVRWNEEYFGGTSAIVEFDQN